MTNNENLISLPITIDDLSELLRSGKIREHRYPNVELKVAWAQSHGQKLSALANKIDAQPRWMVVGVSDDGRVMGNDENWAKRTEQAMSQQINDNLNPVQACTMISCRDVGGSWVIIAGIRNPGDVVYWGDKAYLASGTTIAEMAPDQVLGLRIQLPGLSDYSRQPVSSTPNPDLVSRFRDKLTIKGIILEGSAIQTGDPLLVLKEVGLSGTQAERILFGDCSFRLVRYRSDGEPVSNKTFPGIYKLLSDELFEDTQLWAQQQLRTNEHPYPGRALKEALANAVAHTAYFENDGDIIIEQYPDRITIGNLSVRESAYFANRWFSRSHKTVNGLLMEALRLAGHVDELGRGKHLIFAESIKKGKRPPLVVVEKAGRYDRWKLTLYGGTQDSTRIRILDRCRSIYRDEQKALIALSLVLWRDRPVSEIKNFIDGDFSRQFAQVLAGLEGPIFYYREGDRITLRRWAAILLGEGKDSKAFSPAEERNLREFAYDIRMKYHDGYITPRDLRQLAAMADTHSEQVLSSAILKKWNRDGLVEWVKRGHYRFIYKPVEPSSILRDLIELLGSEEESKNGSA